MTDLKPLIANIVPEIQRLRRELHAHPEPGYKEVETARRVVAALETCGAWSLRTGVAVTGVVATLGADKPGPCVALRADMDCLPIAEETGAPHASTNPGLMHACGHDGHTAALVGAALVLAQIRDELQGPVKLIFQPAEEGLAGGRRMVEEGALEDPHVVAIFGAHNSPAADLVLGEVALRPGPCMGGGLNFFVDVRGRGGHAATPHMTVDPIFVGAQIVNALQSLVSRTCDPLETLVVTVGSFHAGTAINIIPDNARLEGTVRSLSPKVLEEMPARFEALVRGVAQAHGAQAGVTFQWGYPVTVNEPRATDYAAEVARVVAGGECVKVGYPAMLGSEDFAFYLQRRPGCYYMLGTRPADRPQMPFLHHPKFDYNDDALPLAIEMHCELARRFAAAWKT
jgi:amidohydrolase